MPFAPIPVTTEDFVTYLTENFGTEVNTKNLFQASEHFNCSLATVKKRLKQYKQGIGKWDLTIQEKLEITYNAPAASPAIAENLVPSKDPNFVPFGNFPDVKKIIQSGIFYPLHSSQVYLVMVRLLVLSKHVLLSRENSSESTSLSRQTKTILSVDSDLSTVRQYGTTVLSSKHLKEVLSFFLMRLT